MPPARESLSIVLVLRNQGTAMTIGHDAFDRPGCAIAAFWTPATSPGSSWTNAERASTRLAPAARAACARSGRTWLTNATTGIPWSSGSSRSALSAAGQGTRTLSASTSDEPRALARRRHQLGLAAHALYREPGAARGLADPAHEHEVVHERDEQGHRLGV